MPAEGYYQVVLPDGSNTTFKDSGNGFECLNAHSKMEKGRRRLYYNKRRTVKTDC